MAGYVVLIVGIVIELIIVAAVKRGTWSPITGLAVGLLVVGIFAAAWVNRNAVINGAARFWTWVQTNINEILKWVLVATFFLVTIYMFWTLATAAVEKGEITIPLTHRTGSEVTGSNVTPRNASEIIRISNEWTEIPTYMGQDYRFDRLDHDFTYEVVGTARSGTKTETHIFGPEDELWTNCSDVKIFMIKTRNIKVRILDEGKSGALELQRYPIGQAPCAN